MDFYEIVEKQSSKKGSIVVTPEFKPYGVHDLICKGGTMYAFWNEDHWDTDISHLFEHVDDAVLVRKGELEERSPDTTYTAKLVRNFSSGLRQEFDKYIKLMPETNVSFNSKIIFASDEIKREDYSTNRLEYDPKEGITEAFDTLMDRLYEKPEKEKILWFMGALLCGDMPKIQKFLFLYGGKGTGKGTVLKIFKLVFKGYFSYINLKDLTSSNPFATAQVKEIPLLVDEDCDMSTITNDTNLLKLVAHEAVTVNQKYVKPYETTFNGLLVTASNQRFKVRNVDSGITRRAVVAEPSTKTFDQNTYRTLMAKIKFEIPAIAYKAMQLYSSLGISYYDDYVDVDMIENSDLIFEFFRERYELMTDPMTLSDLAALYKAYLEDLEFDTKGFKKRIKNEGQRYFQKFQSQARIDGVTVKNVFSGLRRDLIFPENVVKTQESISNNWIKLAPVKAGGRSKLDIYCENDPAQYANDKGTPCKAWDGVTTTMHDIDPTILHYLRVPLNLIVIDFDIKDDNGNKSLKLNLEAASKFPKTYAEVSKSGEGLHLHYIYDGNPEKLLPLYAPDIEVKVYKGKASLRRKLSWCNDTPIAHISTGLPLKEEDEKVFSNMKDWIMTERGMRSAISKALKKEVHANTKPNVDFIVHIFKEAEEQGLKYDLRDMRNAITQFAMLSTHNKVYCLDQIDHINYCTMPDAYNICNYDNENEIVKDEELTFFDIEVFPNMWLVVTKDYGKPCVRHFNPTPNDISEMFKKHLVGFNNLSYDNNILYAGWLGKDVHDIFTTSQKIIKSTSKFEGRYREANALAYADIYDYSAKKQSLKKWEIEMGITHDELEFDFDKPLPEEDWDRCAEYCEHDVEATEALFKYIYSDYETRCILAKISGLSVATKTNKHSAAIIFGKDNLHPQSEFNYPDLSKKFPGYKFNQMGFDKSVYTNGPMITGKSLYMGEDPSEGGYVYENRGVYGYSKTYDVSGMHPSSVEAENGFGRYTKRYAAIVHSRVAIKHGDLDKAKDILKVFGDGFDPYLSDPSQAKSLAKALKIVVNSVYGETASHYENPFRDPRNVDNWVAKRGALFMITLKRKVQEMGYNVIHCKTDSIKIENPDDKIEAFVMDFGKQYGYTFEIEDTWQRIALINRAVIIGQTDSGEWKAVGKQFAVPYVMKTLFTHEEITKDDFIIASPQVKSALYMGEYPVRKSQEVPNKAKPGTMRTVYSESAEEFKTRMANFDPDKECQFVGRICRIYASRTGSDLIRYDRDKNSKGYATGTKGFKWRLASDFKGVVDVDMDYYDGLVRDAIEAINKVGPSARMIDDLDKRFNNLLTFY